MRGSPMSSVESPNATAQTEALDRTLEQMPAWGIPRLTAISNMAALWEDARKRTYDSHKAQMATLGVPVEDFEPMGDFNIQGDKVENHYHVAATPTPPTPALAAPTVVTEAKRSLARKLAVPILCGALGIGGPIAGFILSQWGDKPESSTTIVQQPSEQDWKLGVQVSDRP